MVAKTPRIPEFYAGRSIFITGATGFMGKVLVERLLSTCPDVHRLYLLMRTKRDLLPEKRLTQLKQSMVFDQLRRSNPSQLDKLHIVPGDVSCPQLGMTQDTIAQLRDVSVVFHSAATLKFDEALRTAVDQNVRSVMRLLDICDSLPNIEVFVHVSTAYANADLETVEERVYPAPVPPEDLLALVDSAPPGLLAEITQKYISPKPNTYTFTKAMAESAVVQHGNRPYSVAIFRPTIDDLGCCACLSPDDCRGSASLRDRAIVVSSLRTPVPGWIENLNGPSGVIVGGGKGLLHVFPCRPRARADLLPVDIAIDTLLAVGWETAMDKSQEVKVYNCSTQENPILWQTFKDGVRRYVRQHPMDNVMWYPYGMIVESSFWEKTLQMLLQTAPLHLAQYMIQILGIKTQLSLITADQKIRAMSNVLKFFTLRDWRFETGNVQRLKQRLCKEDAAVYNLDPMTIDWDEHIRDFVKGCRKYLLKEKDQDKETARRHMRRLFYLHNGLLLALFLLLSRLLLQNQAIYSAVQGTLKLLLSLFNFAYRSLMV